MKEITKKEENLWKELNDDSYVWGCLRRYGNTILGYSAGTDLIKKIWYKTYSERCPKMFKNSQKYSKKYKHCLKEIEKYISEKYGKPVQIRFVKTNIDTYTDRYFLAPTSGYDKHDYWIIETKRG